MLPLHSFSNYEYFLYIGFHGNIASPEICLFLAGPYFCVLETEKCLGLVDPSPEHRNSFTMILDTYQLNGRDWSSNFQSPSVLENFKDGIIL